MKNPNSKLERAKKKLTARWQGADIPGSAPRFQLSLFSKDVFTYFAFPILCIVGFKSCELLIHKVRAHHESTTSDSTSEQENYNSPQSQIISFVNSHPRSRYYGIARRSPGTLVKVRLLNVVDTYANAPVDVEIIDSGLGKNLIGSTILGTASGEDAYRRVNIEFNMVRRANNPGSAIPIKARALSLDGTLGLAAQKKDGFFARSALDAESSGDNMAQSKIGNSGTLDGMIARALASGLLQEFGSDNRSEQNHSQLLTLKPMTEFYVELTSYFPASGGAE